MQTTPTSLRRLARAVLTLVLGLAVLTPSAAGALPVVTIKPIVFPVEGPVRYSDTFGAARSGGRTHEGTDLMGSKMQPLLAAVSGTVTRVRFDNLSAGGSSVVIRGWDGWTYHYLHVNNDTPGTDDGLALRRHAFPDHIVEGARVAAGDVVGYLGDSGNAESTGAHLHFEMREPALDGQWAGTAINPYASLRQAELGGLLPGQDTFGVHRGTTVHLTNTTSGGSASTTIEVGLPGDRILVGDWDGDGIDTLGVHRSSTFLLTNDPSGQDLDIVFSYGWKTDRAVVGDWDGDGRDTIGVRRGNAYYLRNALSGGPAHLTYAYGNHTDTPVTGDWDGNGTDTPGIRRGNAYYLRNAHAGGAADLYYAYGNHTDTPVTGDWDGNGTDTPGIRRGNMYYLRNAHAGGPADYTFSYGWATDIPIVGDWDGS